MTRTSRCLAAAGIVGLAFVGVSASPASAVTVQPVDGSGVAACPAPAAWSAVPAGVVEPGTRFQPSDDGAPEHLAEWCADRTPDVAPGLDDGLGWLLWRGPDWGVPSLGTFV